VNNSAIETIRTAGKTIEVIYSMLIESTGTHFLDSGGDSGRHWQANQERTCRDFARDPVYRIYDLDTEYPYCRKSVYQHLVDSLEYLDQANKDLVAWVAADPYHWDKNPDGRCLSSTDDVMEYMSLYHGFGAGDNGKNLDARSDNTYNGECDLTQNLQYVYLGDTYDCDIIALSIHNGADLRGGYTNYKIFRIDPDMFYDWYLEPDVILQDPDDWKDYAVQSWWNTSD